MKLRKPAAADVTYKGRELSLHRWSESDNRQTMLRFEQNVATRVVDTGSVRCARCNKFYSSPPEKCLEPILVKVQILRSDGRIEADLTKDNLSEAISLPEPRNSTQFDGRLDLRIYEAAAATNPETWTYMEA